MFSTVRFQIRVTDISPFVVKVLDKAMNTPEAEEMCTAACTSTTPKGELLQYQQLVCERSACQGCNIDFRGERYTCCRTQVESGIAMLTKANMNVKCESAETLGYKATRPILVGYISEALESYSLW